MSDDAPGPQRPRATRPIASDQGVYGISVAADLVGMGVQRLRLYESRGLLEPDRTPGGSRRYSQDDLDRLRRIDTLLDAGLNLAGIAMVLDLQDENDRLNTRSTDPHPSTGARQSTEARKVTDAQNEIDHDGSQSR